MKWIYMILAIILFSACSQVPQPQPDRTTYLVLADISESVRTPQMILLFSESADRIIDRMDERDVLVASFISARSVAEHSLIIEDTLGCFRASTSNPDFARQEREEFDEECQKIKSHWKEKIKAAIGDTFNVSDETDILSALHLAADVFKNYPGQQNQLVIMSDMIESTGKMDLGHEKTDSKHLDQLIGRIAQEHPLPDLTGIDVRIVGADASSTDKFMQIRDFWIAFFTRCGAICKPEHYAATLIGF